MEDTQATIDVLLPYSERVHDYPIIKHAVTLQYKISG